MFHRFIGVTPRRLATAFSGIMSSVAQIPNRKCGLRLIITNQFGYPTGMNE
jgi:hypothetical protein